MGFSASHVLQVLALLQGKPRHGTGLGLLGFPAPASLCSTAVGPVSPLNKRAGGNGELRKGQGPEKEEFTAC